MAEFVLSEAISLHNIGRVDSNYQGVDNGVPLLNSFYFRFEKPDSGEAVENRIMVISVFPAGSAKDLTPTADLHRPNVESGKIMLIYQDQAADEDKDHYFSKVSHLVEPSPIHPVPVQIGNVRRFHMRDVGCTGKCVRLLPIRPSNREVFVLVGFHLFFTGGRDHNIDEIAIFEESGNLTVAFNDRNDDDVFAYGVDFALWSPDATSTIETHEERGTAMGGARIALPRGEKVIQGFSFNFKTGDHFLRDIGVLIGPSLALPSSNLEVYFSDQNGDDTKRPSRLVLTIETETLIV